MKIPLIGSSYKGVSAALDTQRTTNLMEEFADSPNAENASALIATPGLAFLPMSNSGTPLQCRGLYQIPVVDSNLNELLRVCGTNLARIVVDSIALGVPSYSQNFIGTLPAGNPVVRWASSPLEVIIVNGGPNAASGYAFIYTPASGALSSKIIFAGGAAINFYDVVYIGQYFVGFIAGERLIQYSDFTANTTDASNWPADNFFQDESTPGLPRRLIVKNGHLWLLKSDVMVIFAESGDANDPFKPLTTSNLNVGTVDGDSVAVGGEHIYGLGCNSDGSGLFIYRITGAAWERISNAFVEKVLSDMLIAAGPILPGFMNGVCIVERGRPLYKLHLINANTTLVFDQLAGKWHARRFWNADTGDWECEIGWIEAAFNGKNIVGDRRADLAFDLKGSVYESSELFLSNDILALNGSAARTAGTDTFIRRERISPHFTGPNREGLFCDRIELLFERGTAPQIGQGSAPKVSLEISRDGGNNWANERMRAIGPAGKFRQRCIWDRNGESPEGFVFRIVMTDPIAWKLIGAWADMEAVQ